MASVVERVVVSMVRREEEGLVAKRAVVVRVVVGVVGVKDAAGAAARRRINAETDFMMMGVG